MSSKSPKPREPRLRASCDACFLAKVKCSKDRPVCSRCLTNGDDCRYSPSSRAGKPKSDGSVKRFTTSNQAGYNNILIAMSDSMAAHMPIYELNNSHMDTEASLPRSVPGPSVLGIPEHMLSFANSPMEMDSRCMSGNMTKSVPSGPALDAMGLNAGNQAQHGFPFLPTTLVSSQSPPWVESTVLGPVCFPTVPAISTMPTNGFVSVQSPPFFLPETEGSDMTSRSVHDAAETIPYGGCGCFNILLQSLQSLHDLQSSPHAEAVTLEIVLRQNRKARESCTVMLSCRTCMRQEGVYTTAMVLVGAVIEQILNIYKNASHPLGFESDSAAATTSQTAQRERGLSVSVGAYKLGEEGARQLWSEALNQELNLLKNVHDTFQKVCATVTGNPEVCRALARHLEQELGNTMANHRRNSLMGSP